jgi:DNA-binding SARP family transcriptional activator
MDGRVVLLGRPRIEAGDRPVQLAGRKPWGLLAYLCLEPPATRQELAGLLFSAADDPLAALRWSLLQVRRALTGLAEVSEEQSRLSIGFAAGVEVDAPRVLSGDVPVEEAKRLQSGELLEGLTFDDEPGFDGWLLLQRSRVGAAVGEVLAWAASTLAYAEPEAALEVIGRATRADPFNDSLHELAVEIHMARGDRPAAEAWVRHVTALYGKELGEPAPETIRRPLDRPRPAADAPLIRLDTAARALLEGAQARFDAGDYQGGLEMARRAASSAAGSGDVILESRALVTLGGILVHSLRGRDREALGLLRRAQQLATTVDHPELVADAEREIGYVAFLEARYGAAEEALQRSIASAQEIGDAARAARALLYRGCVSRTAVTTGRQRRRSSLPCATCLGVRRPGGPTGRPRWLASICGRAGSSLLEKPRAPVPSWQGASARWRSSRGRSCGPPRPRSSWGTRRPPRRRTRRPTPWGARSGTRAGRRWRCGAWRS